MSELGTAEHKLGSYHPQVSTCSFSPLKNVKSRGWQAGPGLDPPLTSRVRERRLPLSLRTRSRCGPGSELWVRAGHPFLDPQDPTAHTWKGSRGALGTAADVEAAQSHQTQERRRLAATQDRGF